MTLAVLTNSREVLISQIVVLISVLIGAWQTRRHVVKLHESVNGKAQDQINRIEQLSQALQGAGVAIPPRAPSHDERIATLRRELRALEAQSGGAVPPA